MLRQAEVVHLRSVLELKKVMDYIKTAKGKTT